MEKMVPTDTFTSMLEEPSSGSMSTTYLLLFCLSKLLMLMKSSSSSEAMPQTISRFFRVCMNFSLASTSSFCWFSPWMLTSPAAPIISTSPALFTSWFTTFAARRMPLSNRESSPDVYWNEFWLAMMNSPRVRCCFSDMELLFYLGANIVHFVKLQRFRQIEFMNIYNFEFYL